ncbi:MAG TPA: hypothetical protein VLF90_02450 [Patescibacteria group bacterium]|nr:hypothetical protein [Patescibacteria group bacterium]
MPDSEKDPQFRRVTFDYPRERDTEFFAAMNGFLAAHNLTLEYIAPEQPISAIRLTALNVEVRQFNPDLVEFVTDTRTGRVMALVTRTTLHAFENRARTGAIAERIANGFSDAFNLTSNLRPYVYVNEDGEIVGLRAELLPDLLQQIEAKRVDIGGVGDKCIDGLDLYCGELYVDGENVQK